MRQAILMFLCTFLACPRPPLPVKEDERAAIGEQIAAFRAQALEPAKIPPPSLGEIESDLVDGTLIARASLSRPEDASWNRWINGEIRLFNNRAALLFDILITGDGPVSWDPAHTTLEINDEHTVIFAAGSAEILLSELLFHAYLEQQWGFDGDLLNRTRGAGPFRMAYAPPISQGALGGVIAFPLDGLSNNLHIVALRLTVPVIAADGVHTLVWVFD